MSDSQREVFLPPVSSPALSETVVETLRETIARGGFAPGQHLREAELAEALRVSRGPIREALTQLEREGLVLLRRHRGAQVVELSPSDIEEIYTLRLALERLAAARAATSATAQHFEAFDRVLERMARLREDYEPREAATLDVEFHDIVYDAAEHSRLSRSWQQIRSQVYVFLYSRSLVRHDFDEIAFSEHTQIRQVLASGQPDAAVTVVEEHLGGAYRRLIGTYDQPAAPDRLTNPKGSSSL